MIEKNELDQALGSTPPMFSARIDETLLTLKEETGMKHIRRTLAIALAVLLLIGVAVAWVATQGQDWYYHNRFTAYQNNEPDKQQAILENLTTDIPQEQTDTGVVSVTVQDVAWAPENGVATLSLSILPLDPEHDELHSIWTLDEDGSWSDTLDPSDPDSRTEHWLWTDKGYGPPAEMMDDASKRLLFLDDGDAGIYIGRDGDVALPPYYFDQFPGENGNVISVMEFDLTQLDSVKIREQSDAFVFDPAWGMPEDEWTASHAETLRTSLEYADAANAAIAANTDENGMLTLRYEYRVVPFMDNALLTDEAVHGTAIFQIKVN